MPFVKEPHFCRMPMLTALLRIDTVWQCPKCKNKYRLQYRYGTTGEKIWRVLPNED